MAPVTRALSRNQIARIVGNDPEAIKALERLFTIATELAPEAIALLTESIAAVGELTFQAQLEAGAGLNKAETFQQNFQTLDYLDFNRVGPHAVLSRRMQWNEDDGTVNMGLNNGVVLQTGQEFLVYAKNASGVTIANGTPVMWTGAVGLSGKIEISLAVADGTIPSNYMLGVATQEIPPNAFGYITQDGKVRGFRTDGTPQGETWALGDELYFSATTPGTLTNIVPQAPGLAAPIAIVTGVSAGAAGSILVRMEPDHNNATLSAAVRTVTGIATVVILSDYVLLGDATAGPVTVTLPSAASLEGRTLIIKKIDSTLDTVTIAANGGETIDGEATQVIYTQYTSKTIVSDGTEWWII